MSKIKNSGLIQYGAEPFEQQQFGTAAVEGIKIDRTSLLRSGPDNSISSVASCNTALVSRDSCG